MIDTKRFTETFKNSVASHYGKPLEKCSNFEKYAALVRMMAHTATINRAKTREAIAEDNRK